MSEQKSRPDTAIDPAIFPRMRPIPASASNAEAAIGWRNFGFHVIPIVPGTKRSSVRWDPWLAELSLDSIARHWGSRPDQEVGVIVGGGLFVLDADSPESLATIVRFEKQFGVTALLINATPKGGQHRFYRRATGTHAKPDAHDSKLHPDRPDVRTGRSLIILPPAPGRSILSCKAECVDDLDEIGQDFIDAIAQHNGRDAPRPRKQVNLPVTTFTPSSDLLRELKALIDCLDPDTGYADWIQILMAVFHATGGSDDGLALADAWSSRGSKYQGIKDIESKWESFRLDEPNPVTIATLRHMVNAAGHDWVEVCDAVGPQFEVCAFEIIAASENAKVQEVATTRLGRYSLRGRSGELEQLAIESVFVLGKIGLKGQATVIFAAPNTGKTLLVLYLLIEAIQAGRIDPEKLYYLNMDDTHKGILEKTRIAEEYGFHLLAEGHRDFSARTFLGEIETMIAAGEARGVIIILDTLKKFVNVMDKVQSARFAQIIRRFVMQGGTLFALAHTNKNPGSDGKPRYGGTSDIVDDIDCAYTLAVVTDRDETEYKVVEFENFKRRGFVAETAAYRYDAKPHDAYLELLLSVEEIDPTQVATLRQAEQNRTDAEMVDAIKAIIRDGITTRMKMARAVMQRVGASRRRVLEILDRYTGDDLKQHHWRYSTGPRGAWVYQLLDDSDSAEPDADDEVLVIDV